MKDERLVAIREKIENGVRLSDEDAKTMLSTRDVWTLGDIARQDRLRRYGNQTFYNINRHINYSNICALSCQFCAFFRKRGQDGAYEFSPEEVVQQAVQAEEAGATEVHIVGGLHPFLKFDYYTDMLQGIKKACPSLHIKAFTAVEIVHLARISKRGKDIKSVLIDLRDAGLDSLPGGGAEVFDDRVHDEVFKGKIRSDQWLQVHEIAHELGIKSNATLLYGHIESLEDRIFHLKCLRDAQDKAINNGHPGHFQTLIPLPFFPDESQLQHLPGPTALDNLRMIAASRLYLDNFDHIKAFWIMQSIEMAQLLMDFGADDLDGTVVWYDITKLESDTTHQEFTEKDLKRLILEAGYQPVERDTLYNPVFRDEKGIITEMAGASSS